MDSADRLKVQAIVDERDKTHLSVDERAELVSSLLLTACGVDKFEHPLLWDLVCFASQFLGVYAVACAHPRLLEATGTVAGIIWSAHYTSSPDAPFHPTSPQEHIALWEKRIASATSKEN